MNNRAEFSAATRKILAERAGYQCSVLNCGRLTVGPGRGQGVVRTGMAAHIYAASSGGPRGTGGLSIAERGEPENGIWCCYSHGKAIDSDAGNGFSVIQLKAWKRLHEARKGAEILGVPHNNLGLVESISINSAPAASLAGRKFELGMRNIITGDNGSGKTVLAKLVASVAYPNHVAEMSRERDVDIEIHWFDPLTHDVATTGRSGYVNHILDGRSVPYVARPYKTILLDPYEADIGDLVKISQMFDLSLSAMRGTLSMLAESSDIVKSVEVEGTRIDWLLDNHGRTVRTRQGQGVGSFTEALILFELASVHARYHASVEPTVLLLDGFPGRLTNSSHIPLLDRLQVAAEHAQVAVITLPERIQEMPSEWTVTALEYQRPAVYAPDVPVDFVIDTTTARPSVLDPQ